MVMSYSSKSFQDLPVSRLMKFRRQWKNRVCAKVVAYLTSSRRFLSSCAEIAVQTIRMALLTSRLLSGSPVLFSSITGCNTNNIYRYVDVVIYSIETIINRLC